MFPETYLQISLFRIKLKSSYKPIYWTAMKNYYLSFIYQVYFVYKSVNYWRVYAAKFYL